MIIRPLPPPTPQARKILQELAEVVTTPTPTAPSARTSTAPSARTSTASSGPSPAEIARRERAAAEARARTAANNAARQSAMTDLERLNAQITANLAKRATNQASLDELKKLAESGHAKVRDNALAALDEALATKMAQITATFDAAIDDFRTNLRDNEKSEHDSTFMNFANRAREKQDLVTQALSQGAGESDVLKSQLQALRNWSANQAEVNRAFFDTRASINAGITDLNTSTRTARINEELSTNAAKGQRWDDYFEARAKTYSDMANLDQSNYLLDAENEAIERQKALAEGLVAWLDAGKNAEDYKPASPKSTAAAKPPSYTSPYAALAAQMASSTWENPGVSQETLDFTGAATSTGGLNTATLAAAPTNTTLGTPTPRKRPEGATLRRW